MGPMRQTGVLPVTPNGTKGSIWMAGSGMASDGTSIYFADGNGTFGTTLNAQGFPVDSDLGDTRDQFGAGNKFITPMIAEGKVFVGATNGVAVFGLLN